MLGHAIAEQIQSVYILIAYNGPCSHWIDSVMCRLQEVMGATGVDGIIEPFTRESLVEH